MEEPYLFGVTGDSPRNPHEKGRRRKMDPQDVHKKFIISSVSSSEIFPACNFPNLMSISSITYLMILDRFEVMQCDFLNA